MATKIKNFLNRIRQQKMAILKEKKETLLRVSEIAQNINRAIIEQGFSELLQRNFWLVIVRNQEGKVIFSSCAKSFEEAQELKNQVYWQKEINRLEKEIWETEERIKALEEEG